MNLIQFSILYTLTFLIHGLRALTTKEYDWDLDQFMYSGSRLLHGELAWTKEFDDKSPVVQFLFAIPASLKSTSIWASITILVSLL